MPFTETRKKAIASSYYLALMGRKLSQMNTEDMRQEMSCAGSPDKIIALMGNILNLIWESADKKNIPELINVEFALDRIKAEVKLFRKKQEKKQSSKIMEDLNLNKK
jgi:hypothetical protein